MRFNKIPLAVFSAVFSAVFLLSPVTAGAITIQEEEELSREFMELLVRHYELIEDPMIVSYLEDVGRRLAAEIPPQPFPFQFHILREDVYNAFATPGGHIFINSGLLEAMENEEELAGILAHEMSHVISRHISKKIERSQKIQIATLAGLAASAFLGIGGNSGDAAQAMAAGTIAAGQSAALAYSREDERQADHLGLRILIGAGYSGEGLLTMLEKIRAKQWYGSSEIPSYLSTHPASEERMTFIDAYLHRRIRGGAEESIASADDSEAFLKARARLQAIYGEKAAAIRRFRKAVAENPEDPVARYGYGLALSRVGSVDEAVEQLRHALEKNAFDPIVLTDLAKVYFTNGRYQEALQTLNGAVSMGRERPETLFLLGRTHLELGQEEQAVSILERLASSRPHFPDVHYQLGNAYGRWGKMADAHYHLGLHYRDKKDRGNARFHLSKAMEYTQDPDMKDRIREEVRRTGEDKAPEESAQGRSTFLMPPGRSGKSAW